MLKIPRRVKALQHWLKMKISRFLLILTDKQTDIQIDGRTDVRMHISIYRVALLLKMGGQFKGLSESIHEFIGGFLKL